MIIIDIGHFVWLEGYISTDEDEILDYLSCYASVDGGEWLPIIITSNDIMLTME